MSEETIEWKHIKEMLKKAIPKRESIVLLWKPVKPKSKAYKYYMKYKRRGERMKRRK